MAASSTLELLLLFPFLLALVAALSLSLPSPSSDRCRIAPPDTVTLGMLREAQSLLLLGTLESSGTACEVAT